MSSHRTSLTSVDTSISSTVTNELRDGLVEIGMLVVDLNGFDIINNEATTVNEEPRLVAAECCEWINLEKLC